MCTVSLETDCNAPSLCQGEPRQAAYGSSEARVSEEDEAFTLRAAEKASHSYVQWGDSQGRQGPEELHLLHPQLWAGGCNSAQNHWGAAARWEWPFTLLQLLIFLFVCIYQVVFVLHRLWEDTNANVVFGSWGYLAERSKPWGQFMWLRKVLNPLNSF